MNSTVKPKAARKGRARCGAPDAITAADVLAGVHALLDLIERFQNSREAAALFADEEIEGAWEKMYDGVVIGAAVLDEATGGLAIP